MSQKFLHWLKRFRNDDSKRFLIFSMTLFVRYDIIRVNSVELPFYLFVQNGKFSLFFKIDRLTTG
jgi:hypothetical protein